MSEQVRFRMIDEDLAPVRRACEAGNLSLSIVVRECVLRYGVQVAVELASGGEPQSVMGKKVSGRRLKSHREEATEVTLTALVSYKFNLSVSAAEKWIKMGRVTVDGVVCELPQQIMDSGDAERVGRAAA